MTYIDPVGVQLLREPEAARVAQVKGVDGQEVLSSLAQGPPHAHCPLHVALAWPPLSPSYPSSPLH